MNWLQRWWPNEADPDTSVLKRPAFWVLAAAGSAFVLVLTMTLVIVLPGGDGAGAQAHPVESANPTFKAVPPAQVDDRADDLPPTSTPNGWEWKATTFANLPAYVLGLPQSDVYGPRLVDGAYRAGWDHSALGALGAASQLLPRTQSNTQQAESHIIDGPYKEAVIADTKTTHTVQSDVHASFIGFRFMTYDRNAATIQLLMAQGVNKMAMLCTLNVQWIDNDWRAQAGPPPGGPCMGGVQVDPNQSGFVPWGPTA